MKISQSRLLEIGAGAATARAGRLDAARGAPDLRLGAGDCDFTDSP
jgi:hypothetical protein